jgi:arylsulfatase A-like enzyme
MSDATTMPAGAAANPRLGPLGVVALAAWCGLAAGLLEAGGNALYTKVLNDNHLYHMSRHFPWMMPLGNLALFLALGLVLAPVVRRWPRAGSKAAAYALGTLTLLPALMAAMPYIYPIALAAFALGVTMRLVPLAAARPTAARRAVAWGLPAMALLVAALAAAALGRDPRAEARQAAGPRPPAGAPNVLLIVLDTVRADHLSLYGYARPTSPNLERLAARGVRFLQASSAAPWTLPSHSSLFTGRWPHELSATFVKPLDGTYPTLAEHLASRGYATAGFVANLDYTGSNSGLGRGFARYEDYRTMPVEVLAITKLGDGLKELARGALARARGLLARSGGGRDDRPAAAVAGARAGAAADAGRRAGTSLKGLARSLLGGSGRRKDAELINGQFLDWLATRPDPDRPFFTFLNFLDAHDPYILPEGHDEHFGLKPEGPDDLDMLRRWWDLVTTELSPRQVELARDGYDDCIRYLDGQVGRLFDELDRRGILKDTIVVITADHGEGFGEHALFGHGASLYRPEVHVPLIVLGPGVPPGRDVAAPASLRDVAATIVDLAGQAAGSPLPGSSLAPSWSGAEAPSGKGGGGPVLSEVSGSTPFPMKGRSPASASHGAMTALTEGDLVYIRDGAGGREELYDLATDPGEERDLAGDPARKADLERLRAAVERLGAAPVPRKAGR